MILLIPEKKYHLFKRKGIKMSSERTFKIGVIIDSFLKPTFKEGLEQAVKVGAEGIQVYAVRGEMAPWNLNSAQRKEKKKMVEDHGLTISALCGDLGHGFMDRGANAENILKSKQIVDLALDLGTNKITTHIGVVPEDKNSETYKIMLEACSELAEYANSVNAFFAIETGPETAVTLREFLDQLPGKGVGVNFDPANLVMCVDGKPAEDVKTLGEYIVHTHAKDGIMVKDKDPKKVKEPLDACGYSDLEFSNQPYIELPLGCGHVNFETYLRSLKETGYRGFLTIERETGPDPFMDIRMAVNFLNSYIDKL